MSAQTSPRMTFGFQAAPTSWDPQSDQQMYDEVVEDCRLGYELGYDSVWMLEHHFSDYYPTPSPLVFLSHIAALCPGMGLGTCVLVLPWYHPLRVAEEIAMLNTLSTGPLHLGLGRGTAKSEYDALGVDMTEARTRFAETLDIIKLGLSGEEFTYDGKFTKIEKPIRVRPGPNGKKVNLYGAIGSPSSAEIMGKAGIPPICLAQFPDKLLTRILDSWREAAGVPSDATDTTFPISIKVLVADSEKEADRLGRMYYPKNFAIQAQHYEVDANPWEHIAEYEQFSKMFANLKKLTDPDNIGPHMEMNLVGTPDRISDRLRQLQSIGFNYATISASTPGADAAFRREMVRRFAEEVAPRFDSSFKPRREQASPAPRPVESASYATARA